MIKRKLSKAIQNAQTELENVPHGLYQQGLKSEGYVGGYFQALNDVMLALNGVDPDSRYWPKKKLQRKVNLE